MKESIIDYDAFFYPLDSIHNWNRIYGKRFTQYQFVLPLENYRVKGDPAYDIFQWSGSFCCSQIFGKQNDLILSSGRIHSALDFPLTTVLALLDELDDMVLHYGGHLYLTRMWMSEYMFKSSL